MINIIIVVCMVILAVIDIRSIKSPNHKNFKSSIILLGILGVLSGVFIAFSTFDIENIKDSMSNIIYGLQNAFYTLIASLVLVVIISIYQKFLGFKKESKENLDFITLQVKKLDHLDEIIKLNTINNDTKEAITEIKNHLNQSMESIIQSLLRIIESNKINSEMLRDSNVANTKSLIEHNKTHLNNINDLNARQIELLRDVNMNLKNLIDSNNHFRNNFDSNIKELSSNINKTLNSEISALTSSFTNTINMYFSENFKRFNKGVDNLLQWQEQYKNAMISSQKIINDQNQLLEKLNSITASILNRDENMVHLYVDVSNMMKEYKIQNANLNEKLQTIGNLGASASNALKSMNTFFVDLNSHLKDTNKNLINYTKSIIDDVFVKISKQFEAHNKSMVDSINTRNASLVSLLETSMKNIDSINSSLNNKLQSSIKEINNLGTMMLQNNKDIYDSYQKLGSSIELSLSAISQNTSDVMNDINKNGIEHLQNIAKLYFDDISNLQHKLLSDMSNSININQSMLDSAINGLINKYLESLEQITEANIQSHRELSHIGIEEMKILNSEVSNYIKENALSLNKSNIEILNIVEFLQKELEDSIEKSNALQNSAKENIANIEQSLKNTSDGFKNDYEWFLRRIRDIIGQRM